MKFKTLSTTAFMLTATTAMAQTDLDGVVDILRDQGFTEVEIEREGTRIIVTAEGRGLERRIVYSSDGRILSDDVERDVEDDEGDDDEDDDDERGDEGDENDESDESDEEDDADESDEDDDEDDDEDESDENDDEDDDEDDGED